ncbi:hypothetical protein NL676_007078 [Syzygium grande]|nr:hypothetical protein NL676_007078 [Syzygium grande]
MAETAVPGAIHRRPSGDRPNRTGGSPPPPPPPSSPGDLIGALPDAVIHRIFSFLPLGDVVRTSALSKRWRSTWTAVTDLVFDGGEIEGRRRSTLGVSSIVDSVLSQCTSATLRRFPVTGFDYDEADSPKVDCWLRFAAERRVEDLYLRLSCSPCFYILLAFSYCLSWWVFVLSIDYAVLVMMISRESSI